jgi:hypothetical protein
MALALGGLALALAVVALMARRFARGASRAPR